MLIISFLFLSTLLIVAQTTLLSSLPQWLGKPDLLFLLVVFLAYRVDVLKGAVLVFFIGLIMDIFSGLYLGLYQVIYLFIFFVLKAISKHVALDESTYQVPFAALAYLFAGSAFFVFSSILAPENSLEWSWKNMLLQIVLLCMIAIPLLGLFELFLLFCTKRLAQWRPFKDYSGNKFRS